MESKPEIINRLLEAKNISVTDDYFWDVFTDDKTEEVIFSAKSQKFSDSPVESEKIMDEIISKLESYEIHTDESC